MWWQWLAVGAMEALAVAFLVTRWTGLPWGRRAQDGKRPDVPTRALVRKRPRSRDESNAR